MEDRDIMPDGLIGEPGVGFSKGTIPLAIAIVTPFWVAMAGLAYWMFRG